MKWVFRILTLCSLGIALSVPFFIKDPSGRGMLNLPGGLQTPTLMEVDRLPEPERTIQVYKWQDKDGQWHYSDAPPTGNEAIQIIEVSNRTNIIQSLPPEDMEDPQKKATAPKDAKARDNPPAITENPLTLDNLRNIMQETQAVKELMEQRNRELEQISGGGE